MSAPHNPNVWMLDRRAILSARLANDWFDSNDPTDPITFERFERNGEMAMIPYLRAKSPHGIVTEAPLTHWAVVNFSEFAEVEGE